MPSRIPDVLLLAGAVLIITAAIAGSWPLRGLTAGLLLFVAGLVAAWSDQR